MNRLLAAALITVTLTLAAPAIAQTTATLRIGISPIEVSSEPFYAADMGFFA